MSSLLRKSSFFDPPIDLVNACKIQRIPVYLKIGIIDERKTVVNFAKLFQYFAPIVLGIISEKVISLLSSQLKQIQPKPHPRFH